MSNIRIHPTAIVSEKAQIGDGTSIGAYTVIEDDVIIGENVDIKFNVMLASGTRIGNECKIYPGCIIGTEPQDLKFRGEETYVFIGDRTVIREYATVNRATKATGKTTIGEDCMIMAYCHVAHDCHLGNNVILSNVTQLAGHVTIEDWVGTGGVVKIVQFNRIGAHSFIGADVKITKDVPPYTLIGREPARIEGINKVGLRRRGFSNELIQEIERFYDLVYFSGLNTKDGIDAFKSRFENISEEVRKCIEFIENSTKGTLR